MNLMGRIDKMKDDIIKKTSDLVEFRSIKSDALENAPFGVEIRHSLDYTLNLCKELGFKTKDIDGYAGHVEYGEGDELIGILVHLDVVPEGNGWTYDPFSLTLDNGRLYGRGVNDDKGGVIASIYALKAVMDSGLKMNKRFRIILGCDEESGWECMSHYFAVEEMPSCGFSPDGPFPIVNREKGILRVQIDENFSDIPKNQVKIINLKGGQRANMVPEICECNLEIGTADIDKFIERLDILSKRLNIDFEIKKDSALINLITRGRSAHGSEPELGENAAMKMLTLLSNIEEMNTSQQRFIKFIVNNIGFETEGETLGIDLCDEESGKLTLNTGIVEMTDKTANVILDIRYPVSFKGGDIFDSISKKASLYNIVTRKIEDKTPLYVPKENQLIERLSTAYNQVTGEEPTLIALKGGTYARAIKNAVAFGPIMPGKEDTAHQKDEYLELEDLIMSTKIYAQAIVELNKNY
ncbi:MAG: dipeptidase PepV [Gudongella sp.]|nr:dipeptidase PepV [Gudongella sp.]